MPTNRMTISTTISAAVANSSVAVVAQSTRAANPGFTYRTYTAGPDTVTQTVRLGGAHPAALAYRRGLLWVGDPTAQSLLAVGRDITEQWATAERLRHMATHDPLTGLPNRFLLSDRIRMAIAYARRTQTDTNSRDYDLSGSFNQQHLIVNYKYDSKAVLSDAVGAGTTVGHSGRDNETVTRGQTIEDSWKDTLQNHPDQVWDTSLGTID